MEDTHRVTVIELVRWWEKRRWVYNIVVGLSGLAVLLLMQVDFSVHVLLAIAYYGVLANLCYTFGWAIEVLLLVYFNRVEPMGKYRLLLFLVGTVFSVLLTICSALYWTLKMDLALG